MTIAVRMVPSRDIINIADPSLIKVVLINPLGQYNRHQYNGQDAPLGEILCKFQI